MIMQLMLKVKDIMEISKMNKLERDYRARAIAERKVYEGYKAYPDAQGKVKRCVGKHSSYLVECSVIVTAKEIEEF